MKKFLAILLSALLVVSALAVTVIADTVNWEDGHTVDDKGDYTFDNAYGFVFNINYVDGTIAGEDNTLIVTPSAYVSSNPNWAISVFLAATDDANVYEVISVVSCPANVEGWDINTLWPMSANACLIAHSAYSNASGTNWQAKVAAMALKEGDKITISEDNTTATVQDAPEGYEVTNGVEPEVPTGSIYAEKVVSSYKDYTTSPLFRQNSEYKWSEDAAIAYPDDDLAEEMTNGQVAAFDGNWDNFWDNCAPVIGFHCETPAFEEYAGYAEVGYAWIRVDLGAAANINKLTATVHNLDSTSNITSVTFMVSEDGEAWNEAGKVEISESGDIVAAVELEEAVSAQYVEYRFTGAAYWMFVSEVQAIEVVERNVVNTTVPVTATEAAPALTDGEVIVWNAGEEDRTLTTTEAGLRYQWFIVTDAEGNVVKIGNNLVADWEENSVTVPAGGQLVAFTYNANSPANQSLMDTYNDILLVANNGALIYNTALDVESDYTVVADEQTVTITCNAVPEEPDPEESNPEESDPEESEPAEDLEAELKDFVGEAVDGKFDLVIDAPETYKAGDEITVTVTVANITAENGLHVVKFNFYYDSEKLVLTNDLDEEEDNRLVCIDEENLPSKWENFTKVNNDFDAENAEGTEVKALNDGIIYASALTDKDSSSTAIKEDGKVVFTFTFTANADAEGDIGLAIPHAEVEGALNNAAGAELYAGNGGYAIIAADAGDVSEPEVSDPEVSEPEESKPEEPVVPGDASNMLVFAIIALVAIAGSAVVIKTRK